MNQILSNQFFEKNIIPKKYKRYKIAFWSCILIIAFCIILYLFLKFNSVTKNNIAKKLENNFEIRNLYSNFNKEFTAQKLNTLYPSTKNEPFVIGLLKIRKIELTYPILSDISKELLEISPCRFYGPMPNNIGNMCIAGHNYANQTHFAKLHFLNNGDIIDIYSLDGKKIEYIVYSKQEVSADDISCLSQDTNSFKEITLVTCNSIKGNRCVIKAKEKI